MTSAEIIHLNGDDDRDDWHPAALARMAAELKLLLAEQKRVGGKDLLLDLDFLNTSWSMIETYYWGLSPKRQAKFIANNLDWWREIRKLEEKIEQAANRHIEAHLRNGVNPKFELEPKEYERFKRLRKAMEK
jgi:hypothetical protein